MRIIAVVNQKGGCGKTTTAINLSAALAKQGKEALIVDVDPQAHATLGLGVKAEAINFSTYNVLTPLLTKKKRLDEVIIATREDLDIAPATLFLSAIEQELHDRQEREARLAQAISLMVSSKTYDYIIIDCPPNLGMLTFNALRAASEVIVPLDLGFFSLHGVAKLMETIEMLRKKIRHNLRIRVLINMYERRTLFGQEVVDEIQRHFKDMVFATRVIASVRVREAASHGESVMEYAPSCYAAECFANLAAEVVKDEISAGLEKVIQREEKPLTGPRMIDEGTLFTYYGPEAASVEIVGDFNNWVADKASRMEKTSSGAWAKVMPVKPGRYRYKYIVDGKWEKDPGNPLIEDDSYGGINSVLEINPAFSNETFG